MASTDDLSLLMPSLRRKLLSSAADTTTVREYLRGAARRPATQPDPPVSGIERLRRKGKLRTGRQPAVASFHIQWRPLVLPQPQAAVCEPDRPATDSRDVEQLKDEMLAGYLQRSRERLASKLRTGRVPSNRHFDIRLRPVILPAPPAPEEPASPPALEQDIVHEAEPQPQSVTRPTPRAQVQQAACPTPATNLVGRTPMEGVPERWLPAPQQKCQTPATALVGRTPMEGVPERWTAPRAACQRKPATPAPALPTPMEGVPEGRTVVVVRKVARRLEQQHQGQQSVDSPIEGVVQQGARGASSGGMPAALGDFTFAAAMSEPQNQQGTEVAALTGQAGQIPAEAREPSAAEPSSCGEDELDDDGFDYGGNDEPSVLKRPREAAGASPPPPLGGLEAAVQSEASLHSRPVQGTSPGGGAGLADRAVQTAVSLHGSPPNSARQQEADRMDYGDDGYDAGGFDYDDYDSDHEQGGDKAAAPLDQGYGPEEIEPPETSAHAAQQQQRRRTTNFGARLRNELKRKSLGADPRAGRREVAPGVRRSTRQKQSPLEWWRGETKNFSRQEHKTMPTVKDVVHKSPTTPWRTVTDIYGRHKKRQRHQQQQPDVQENGDS